MNHEFTRQIFTKYLNIKFHQIHPIGAELFHADGQTDARKLIVAFSNFANIPKKREVLEKTKAICACREQNRDLSVFLIAQKEAEINKLLVISCTAVCAVV
jgi:hypothetical protein